MLLGSVQCATAKIYCLKTVPLRRKVLLILYILAVMLVTLFIQLIAANKLFVKDYLDKNPFDINAHAIVAFREIGKGHSAMESLFGFMNFLPVIEKDSFSEMNKDIAVSYSKVAKGCMFEAVNEVHSGADDNLLCDIAVSCDGTWQKRGFSSLLGAVT